MSFDMFPDDFLRSLLDASSNEAHNPHMTTDTVNTAAKAQVDAEITMVVADMVAAEIANGVTEAEACATVKARVMSMMER